MAILINTTLKKIFPPLNRTSLYFMQWEKCKEFNLTIQSLDVSYENYWQMVATGILLAKLHN